jgi:putative sigma-54 modulation protein
MNITVTFRHVDTSEAIKKLATDKIAKLQKFLRQPMTARVTVSLEKLKHMVEARVSSGGEHYEAHEVTEDMYTSIDKVLDKLERQIRGNKGAAQTKKRRGVTLRIAAETPDGQVAPIRATRRVAPKARPAAVSAPRAAKRPSTRAASKKVR